MSNRDQDSKRNRQQESQRDLKKSPEQKQKSGGFASWSSSQ